MHGLNIIHRDLKPENLVRIMTFYPSYLPYTSAHIYIFVVCIQLLTSKGAEAEVKLIDFGLAKEMSDSVARSFLGTRGYLAPEMLQRLSYDKSIDIWVSLLYIIVVIVFIASYLLCDVGAWSDRFCAPLRLSALR